MVQEKDSSRARNAVRCVFIGLNQLYAEARLAAARGRTQTHAGASTLAPNAAQPRMALHQVRGEAGSVRRRLRHKRGSGCERQRSASLFSS